MDSWPVPDIFPAIAAFELDATVSKMHRKGKQILRDFFIVNEAARIYPIDQALIQASARLRDQPEFAMLHGADLVYACIAHIEDAFLITLDNHFAAVASKVKVVKLNERREAPNYREVFGI